MERHYQVGRRLAEDLQDQRTLHYIGYNTASSWIEIGRYEDAYEWFSKQEKPDVLLTLTQPSMNKFSKDTTPQSTIIADTGLSIPGNCAASKIYRIPILETASKVVGKPMTANIVAVSAINTILGLFPEDIMLEAVKMHIPAGTEELNMKAFDEGKHIAENAKVVFTSAFMTPERM